MAKSSIELSQNGSSLFEGEKINIIKNYSGSPTPEEVIIKKISNGVMDIKIENNLGSVIIKDIPADRSTLNSVLSWYQNTDEVNAGVIGQTLKSDVKYSEIKNKIFLESNRGDLASLSNAVKTQSQLDSLAISTLISNIQSLRSKVDITDSRLVALNYNLGKRLIENPHLISEAANSLGREYIRDYVINNYFGSSNFSMSGEYSKMYNHLCKQTPNLPESEKRYVAWKLSIIYVYGVSNEQVDRIYKSLYPQGNFMSSAVAGPVFSSFHTNSIHISKDYKSTVPPKRDMTKDFYNCGLVGIINITAENAKSDMDKNLTYIMGYGALAVGAFFAIKAFWKKTGWMGLGGLALAHIISTQTTGQGLFSIANATLFGGMDRVIKDFGGDPYGTAPAKERSSDTTSGKDTSSSTIAAKEKAQVGISNSTEISSDAKSIIDKISSDKKLQEQYGGSVILAGLFNDSNFSLMKRYLTVGNNGVSFNLERFKSKYPDGEAKTNILASINKNGEKSVLDSLNKGISDLGINSKTYTKISDDTKVMDLFVQNVGRVVNNGVPTHIATSESSSGFTFPSLIGSAQAAEVPVSSGNGGGLFSKDGPSVPHTSIPATHTGSSAQDIAAVGVDLSGIKLPEIKSALSVYTFQASGLEGARGAAGGTMFGPNGKQDFFDLMNFSDEQKEAYRKNMPNYYLGMMTANVMLKYYHNHLSSPLTQATDVGRRLLALGSDVFKQENKRGELIVMQEKYQKAIDKINDKYNLFMASLGGDESKAQKSFNDFMESLFPQDCLGDKYRDIQAEARNMISSANSDDFDAKQFKFFSKLNNYLKEIGMSGVAADVANIIEPQVEAKSGLVPVKAVLDNQEFVDFISNISNDPSSDLFKGKLKRFLTGLGIKEASADWKKRLSSLAIGSGIHLDLDTEYTVDGLVDKICFDISSVKTSLNHMTKEKEGVILDRLRSQGVTGTNEKLMDDFKKIQLKVSMMQVAKPTIMKYFLGSHPGLGKNDPTIAYYEDMIGTGWGNISALSSDQLKEMSEELAIDALALFTGGGLAAKLSYRFLSGLTKSRVLLGAVGGAARYEGFTVAHNLLTDKGFGAMFDGSGDWWKLARFAAFEGILGGLNNAFTKLGRVEMTGAGRFVQYPANFVRDLMEMAVKTGVITAVENIVFDETHQWTTQDIIESLLYVIIVGKSMKNTDGWLVTKSANSINVVGRSAGKVIGLPFSGAIKETLSTLKGDITGGHFGKFIGDTLKTITLGSSSPMKYKLHTAIYLAFAVGPQAMNLYEGKRFDWKEFAGDAFFNAMLHELITLIYGLNEISAKFMGGETAIHKLGEFLKPTTQELETVLGKENTRSFIESMTVIPWVGDNLRKWAKERLTKN